jgi:outer membrane receptor protein involved in Fe transport
MRTTSILSFFVITILFSAASASAQGRIEGQITDAESGEALPGVVVQLRGTALGASTDINGHYALTRVPAGSYTLDAALIGYRAAEHSVEIEAGSTASLDLQIQPSPIHLNEVLVQSERALSAASSSTVRHFDLEVRPKRSAHQMLQLVPGLIIAQHAGGGKAEQVFLRGFDADHGTDVAISVDGMPVNMVSHGHGQGYADLHFLIPDVVEQVDVFKGPYSAQYGNLATAGAVSFRTRDHLDANMLRLEGGQFNSGKFTMLYQLPLANPNQSAYFAGNFYNTDGPVDSPQGFQRANLFAKVHTHLSERSTLTLDLSAFSSAWDASGQIPQRAIANGLIDRWGSIDDLEGGTTGRRNANLTFRAKGSNNSELQVQTYAVRYDFKLFSNFTFFLDHPVVGDGIEQIDDRQLFGIDSRYSFYHALGRTTARTSLGGGLRADDADVALWHSPERQRSEALVDSRVLERNLYMWAQEEIFLNPQLRLVLGLRGDYFTFNVEDHLEGQPADLPHASGYAQDFILNPKATLVYSPTRAVDFFANFGTGFHSNDARDVVLDQRATEIAKVLKRQGLAGDRIDAELAARHIDPGHLGAETLPRATGGELGLRSRLFDRLNVGAAFWLLDLDSEFVYIGDAGTTEESGRTRRIGIDLEARLRLLPWLWADTDLNLSRGEARDEPASANEIPLAPQLTSTGGLTARHKSGLEGSLRYRHIGDRPANEDGSATAIGYTVFELSGAYRTGPYRLSATVENLFDSEWNEAQFDTESRLQGEVESVSEIHFTPGNPFNARIGLSYFF